MGLGIQSRLFAWLILVVLPIAAACFFTVKVIDNRLTQRVHAGLENDHRLEAARIEAALEQYRLYAKGLSYTPQLRTLVKQIHSDRYLSTDHVSDHLSSANDSENFSVAQIQLADNSLQQRLQQLTNYIQNNARLLDSGLTELKIVTPDGFSVGQTSKYSWNPGDKSLVEESIRTGEAVFGKAFLNSSDEPSLGMVVPVFSNSLHGGSDFVEDAPIMAFLLLEMKLGPVVDLVVAHEGLGETSESHIAQPTADGDAEFITLMRFARDAAFKKVVPKEKDLPINWSLESPEMRVVRSPDYRGIDSALAIGTLPATGWGLVVKIDDVEAFKALTEVKQLVWIAGCVSVFFILLSWIALLKPLARRLHSTAIAADRVAAGDYLFLINDHNQDEIGALATSIDRLATDLNHDMALREQAEQKLKYQAEHDVLTGLFNRTQIQNIMEKLEQQENHCTNSILFLDLDGFKQINDQHGHHIGDEILIGVASELQNLLDDNCTMARWGGDEFVVLMPDADERKARCAANRISSRFESSFPTSAGNQLLGCSIGISTSNDKQSLEQSLQQADAKMYEAKQIRKNSATETVVSTRLLRCILSENRVEVCYQPIVDSFENNERIAGVKALPHIRSESGTLITADEAIPDIQSLTASLELDFHAMRRAFKDFSFWRELGLIDADCYLLHSLRGPTMRMSGFPHFLRQELDTCRLQADSIVIDLSLNTLEVDLEVVSAIKSLGVRVSVGDCCLRPDQFERLINCSPEFVTINGNWSSDLQSDSAIHQVESMTSKKKIVLEHLIATCNELDIHPVIDGTEPDRWITLLNELGVSRFRGSVFEKLLSREQFDQKLRRGMPSDWTDPQQAHQKAS